MLIYLQLTYIIEVTMTIKMMMMLQSFILFSPIRGNGVVEVKKPLDTMSWL